MGHIRQIIGRYKYLFQAALAQKLVKLDIDLGIRTADRKLLEQVILPFFAQDDHYDNILFVGCEWYTRKYNKMFAQRNYWTMEMDPELAPYGGAQHIIGKVETVGAHFEPNSLDLVVCNGVFGWGLDQKADIETAFEGIFTCLKPSGIFLLGWNDVPEHSPIPLAQLMSLGKFKDWIFPPLSTSNMLASEATQHRYHFYQKPLV